MKSLIIRIFIQNWPRKLISLILAIIVWFVVSQSMATTKTISNIGIRILNIPEGKTVEGLQSNGLLQKRVTLTLSGNKNLLDELTSNDIEVVIDAVNQRKEWIATISKKNLLSLNPDINLTRRINKISHKNFIIKLTNLVTERIPVIITQPIGQAPKGYQFLDIWPYQLNLNISGPEDVVKEVKNRGIKLTFNLNDISESQLDDLQSSSSKQSDVVSFFVPKHWKHVSIPILSTSPITIDDPDAKFLRIDFVRSELIPINHPIPISLFVPPHLILALNPQKLGIVSNEMIENKNGIKLINQPLYAKGVSELFLETISDMIGITVIANPKPDQNQLDWTVQFINPKVLEDRYVSTLLSDSSDEDLHDLQPKVREEYLRNRFRSYMNRFTLYRPDFKRFKLDIEMQGNKINITESNHE
ncbi:MAG: hypothetical protein S4CHLAM37_08350 [Chlamydiia bacterium]|nr:hypothetical protein [Chlamydiia bacterium]